MFDVPDFELEDPVKLQSGLKSGSKRRLFPISVTFLGATSTEDSFSVMSPSFGQDQFWLRNFHDRLSSERVLFSTGETVVCLLAQFTINVN